MAALGGGRVLGDTDAPPAFSAVELAETSCTDPDLLSAGVRSRRVQSELSITPRSSHDHLPTEEAPSGLQVAQAAMAADLRAAPIGRVEKISGSAAALRNGTLVALHAGDVVFKGDVVETGRGATLSLKFVDGTVLALSSSSRIELNEMIYAAGASSNSVFFRLIDGVIGLVAGASAKGGEFAVETPTAIMGIRGTAVRIEVLPDGGTRFSLLREPNGSSGTILLLDKADRSRLLGSISDTGAAAIVAVAVANAATVTRVAKTAEELRSEGALVRELFQHLPELYQRRGSGEFGDAAIIPASDLLAPPRVPDAPPFVPVQSHLPAFDVEIPLVPTRPGDVVVTGVAREDGPAVTLIILDERGEEVLLPSPVLPPGVTYDQRTGRFRLDPSDPAFQRLGEGETQLVAVRHDPVDGGVPVTVVWNVIGRNDRPVARADRFHFDETGADVLTVRANDRDIDGDELFVARWTNPIEGSIRLGRNGQLIFDPEDDFVALSTGQTATVTFEYTISDPYGGSSTAIAAVTVKGEGIFSSPLLTKRSAGTIASTGQTLAVELTAPSHTTTSAADIELVVDFGLLPRRSINVVYVIDVSGSTDNLYAGDPVGDLNGDGRMNTVLDAEIAGLIALTDRIRALGFSPADVTVTLVPFNDTADPSSGGAEAIVLDLGFSGDETIANALRTLQSTGGTNFEAALQAALNTFAALDPEMSDENFIAFLSDGAGTGDFNDEVARLEAEFGATINAVGIGPSANVDVLEQIDSDGRVALLTSRDGIDPSFIGFPNRAGEVTQIDLFVNGERMPDVGVDDLVPRGDDFLLRVEAGALSRLSGESNTLTATVTFDSGLSLSTALDILGALPRSTDLIM